MPKKYGIKEWQKKVDKLYGWNNYKIEYVSFDGSTGYDSRIKCNKCGKTFTCQLMYFTKKAKNLLPGCMNKGIGSCYWKDKAKTYHALAKNINYKWLGTELPQNVNHPTTWKCDKGHITDTTSYTNLQQGQRCSMCYRVLEEDYHALGRNINYKWLGDVLPQNVHQSTTWKCEKGHITHTTSYNSLLQGTRCSMCSRVIEEDYHLLAKSIGYKWLGNVLPQNVKQSTTWQCEKGHITHTTSYTNLQQGQRCSMCDRVLEEDYHALARSINYKWLGTELPQNVSQPTTWKCEAGHITHTTSYTNLQQGTRCSVCNESKGEATISTILKELNIQYSPQHKFSNLSNRMSFDFYIPKFNLAIEFQGAGHYKPVNFGGISDEKAMDRYNTQLERDKLKVQFCEDNGIKLWAIPHYDIGWEDKLYKGLIMWKKAFN